MHKVADPTAPPPTQRCLQRGRVDSPLRMLHAIDEDDGNPLGVPRPGLFQLRRRRIVQVDSPPGLASLLADPRHHLVGDLTQMTPPGTQNDHPVGLLSDAGDPSDRPAGRLGGHRKTDPRLRSSS